MTTKSHLFSKTSTAPSLTTAIATTPPVAVSPRLHPRPLRLHPCGLCRHYYRLRREGSVICNKRCAARDLRCGQNATQTITYKFLGLPTIRRVPRPIRLTNIRLVGASERRRDVGAHLSILSGNDAGCFNVHRNKRQGWLQLVAPIFGPIEYHLLLLIKVFSQGARAMEHLAHVSVIVAQYEF